MKFATVRWFLTAVLSVTATFSFVLVKHFEDVHVYYAAAQALFLNGRTDLYSADFADSAIMDYRYPPFFLFLFSPFSLLPYKLVEFIWLWLCIFAFCQIIKTTKLGFELVVPDSSRVWPAILLSLIATAKFFVVLSGHFNVHLIVIAFVGLAFYSVLSRKQLMAAVPMALAITIKISPILTLPYFALRRQWRFLAATSVLVVVFNLLPALYFGWNTNAALLVNWYRHVVANDEFHEVNGPLDLSLRGQLKRYLVDIDYEKRFDDPDYEEVNFLSLSEAQFEQIWRILAAGMFIGTLFIIWRLKTKRRRLGLEQSEFDSLTFLEFGLAISLVLLVAPRTNAYYLIALFFPLIPLSDDLLRKKSNFNIAIFGLVLLGTCILPLVPGRHIQRLFLVLGIDFWVMIVVWIGLIYNLFYQSSEVVIAADKRETHFLDASSRRLA